MPLSVEVAGALGTGLGAAVGSAVGAEFGGVVGAAALGTTFSVMSSLSARAIAGAIAEERAHGTDRGTVPIQRPPAVLTPPTPPADEPPPVPRPTPPTVTAGIGGPMFDELLYEHKGSYLALAETCGLDVDRLAFYMTDLEERGYTHSYIYEEVDRLVRHACEHQTLHQMAQVGALTPGNMTIWDYTFDTPEFIEPMKNTTVPEQGFGIGQFGRLDAVASAVWQVVGQELSLSIDPATGMPGDTIANRARFVELASSAQMTPEEFSAGLISLWNYVVDQYPPAQHAEMVRQSLQMFKRELQIDGQVAHTVSLPEATDVPDDDRKAVKPTGTGALWAIVGVAGVAVLGGGIYVAYRESKAA